MKNENVPSGLCKKTFELAKDLDEDRMCALMDRYCRKDAQFLCMNKFGFVPHKKTLEWMISDLCTSNLLLD